MIEELKRNGLKSSKCVHYSFHTGGSKPTLHFLWKVNECQSEGDIITNCLQVIKKIEAEMPVYERRVTKKQFMNAFGFVD